jgi:hypothetical protein
MLGIWTLRGNSSTARSGWVAAEAANSVGFCWSGACKLTSMRTRPFTSRDHSPDRKAPVPIRQGSEAGVLVSDPVASDTSGRHIMTPRILPQDGSPGRARTAGRRAVIRALADRSAVPVCPNIYSSTPYIYALPPLG